MTKLTRKNVPFNWDEKCRKALQLAKTHLQSSPVMVYPDKSKMFHLFTDALNYTWLSALMQVSDDPLPLSNPPSLDFPERREGKSTLKQKKRPLYVFFEGKPLRAIVFHSGSFSWTQQNWSAFVKESMAIFKAVLRMSFYLTDSDVLIHSDHKLLEKFVYAITANARVNDWSFQIHAICKSIMF